MYSTSKKIYLALVSGIAVSGFIVICTFGQTVKKERVEARLAAAATEPVTEDKPLYIIREYDGRIALFYKDMDKPYRFIEFNIALLPEFDREQLREGIVFDNEQDLRSYIQDVEG